MDTGTGDLCHILTSCDVAKCGGCHTICHTWHIQMMRQNLSPKFGLCVGCTFLTVYSCLVDREDGAGFGGSISPAS